MVMKSTIPPEELAKARNINMQRDNMFCIYHRNCTDGLMAAAVVKHKFPDAEFHAAQYGEQPPYDALAGKEVVIVDFSYPREQMIKICDAALSVIVLDHHKTAKAELETLPAIANLTIEFDMHRSGAGMAWDYLFAGARRPWLVEYVEDRDLWKFDYPETKHIHYALSCEPQTPHHFAGLLGTETQGFPGMLEEFITAGKAMERLFQSQLDMLEKHTFERTIGGFLVPVVNVPPLFASELAGRMAKSAPFAATYCFDGHNYVFSLRSRGEEGIDVSEIAKLYDGGGHRNAAGFKVKDIAFLDDAPAA